MSSIRHNGSRSRIERCLRPVVLGLSIVILADCQTVPGEQPAGFERNRVRQDTAIAEKSVRYEILSELSEVRFLVFRAGPLAKLGHNHVIEARNIRGEIHLAPEIHQSRFFIEMPVEDFLVDAETARRDEGEGFSTQPDQEAVAATRRNMLGEKVLDAARYPTIEIRSVALNGPAWGMDATIQIRMHGVEREVVVPAAVEIEGDRIVATAFLSIKQSDFGIAPMSVLGGALQVENTIKARMRIVASKALGR